MSTNKLFKNLKWDVPTVLKAVVIGLAVIILIAVAGVFVRIVSSSVTSGFSTVMTKQGFGGMMAPGIAVRDSAAGESAYYGGNDGMMDLSLRNVTMPSPLPPYGGTTTGDNAEEYEVTDYTANIETRHLEETCASITGLKSRDDVIFENTSTYDRGCGFSFKVKAASVPEILSIIKDLDPKDFNENSYTIKSQVDDYTSETDILKNKLASIDETLTNSVIAYDELTELATRAQDVESLTKIIDSKLNLIERLTQQRINIISELERISRAKNEQLDRLDYTYFYVSVSENKYLDGEQLADSWKVAMKEFVASVNQTMQDVSINLIAMVLLVLQYVLYIFIIVVVAKYVWRAVTWLWKK